MVRVKLFADVADDAEDLAERLAKNLRDWKSCGAVVEIISASTALTYDTEQNGVHGILTIVYRLPGERKEE